MMTRKILKNSKTTEEVFQSVEDHLEVFDKNQLEDLADMISFRLMDLDAIETLNEKEDWDTTSNDGLNDLPWND